MGMTIGLPSNKATNKVIVMPDERARAAGMRSGDRIVAIDGKPTPDGEALVGMIHKSPNIPLHFTIDRGGAEVALTIVPRVDMQPSKRRGKDGKPVMDKVGIIGVRPDAVLERSGPIKSIVVGTL